MCWTHPQLFHFFHLTSRTGIRLFSENTIQTLLVSVMDLEMSVWSCIENGPRQPVETWTSCPWEVGCKATKLADKISFLTAPNGTVKLGHCSSWRVKQLLKANPVCVVEGKANDETMFVCLTRFLNESCSVKRCAVRSLYVYLHKCMHICHAIPWNVPQEKWILILPLCINVWILTCSLWDSFFFFNLRTV